MDAQTSRQASFERLEWGSPAEMDVRVHVLRHLATPGAAHRFGRPYLPTAVRHALGCAEHEVWEAVWTLVADGLVYLDPEGQGVDNWRWKLSAAGIRVVEGGPWEPRDPDGYLRRLRRQVPALDPLALRYVEEALSAFNARCYLASSVMLGVASEQVFNRLAASFVLAAGDSAGKLQKLIEDPGKTYFTRFQELRKRFEPIRDSLPDGLGDVLTLDAVGDLLRITRNAAGHPSGKPSTRTRPERTCRWRPCTSGR